MVHDVMGVRMTRSAAYEGDVLEVFSSFPDLLLFTLRKERPRQTMHSRICPGDLQFWEPLSFGGNGFKQAGYK